MKIVRLFPFVARLLPASASGSAPVPWTPGPRSWFHHPRNETCGGTRASEDASFG